MDLELRVPTADELPAFARSVFRAFGRVPVPEAAAAWVRRNEHDRTLAVYDGDDIVANAGAFTFRLTMTGGALVPVAGITAVGVRPTHRRRGLLRQMMERQLDDVAERGEPAAILTASEATIYGRFGYGVATFGTGMRIDTRASAFSDRTPVAAGRVRVVERSEAVTLAPAAHDAARLAQPGDLDRPPLWWEIQGGDDEWLAEGGPAPLWLVHEDEHGHVDGYAWYRVKPSWPDGVPAGELQVEEVVAASPAVEAALWRTLLDVDLVAWVSDGHRPLDDPLRWWLADGRQLRVDRVTDHLFVRLVDVEAALSARTLGLEGRLVVDVHDAFRPQTAGRYLLEGSPDGARCTRTSRTADLELDIAELGSCWLGGVQATALGRAGRVVEHTTGALALADAMLVAAPAPFCRTGF